MKDALKKIANGISRLVQSDGFIVVNAALILVGWALDAWVPVLCVVAAINIFPLFIDRHTKHLFNFIMMFSFIISVGREEMAKYTPMLALLGFLIVGMIFNLAFFKRSFMPIHPKNMTGFYASLIALLFPFAFGGINSPAESPLVTVFTVAVAALFCVIYAFFTVCNYDAEERAGFPEYVLKILVASGIVISLEMIIFYGRIGDINEIVQAMMDKKVDLGWAGPNGMAPMLALCIPASFYFCIKKNFATPILATIPLIEYALIISTGCRGAILFTTILLPPIILYTIVKSENKLAFGITVSVVFIVAVILLAYYGNIFANIITTILNKRLDSSGRDELYSLAVDALKTWPLFGAGWDYKSDLFFHSTFFQVMACMGLFGLAIFAVFYFWRYWTFFKMRKEDSTLALLCGMVLFEACGFIDTNYFIPNFFAILLIMTFAVDINVPRGTCLAFGGRDPVAQVEGFFRILLDKVKPVENKNDAPEDDKTPSDDKTDADK